MVQTTSTSPEETLTALDTKLRAHAVKADGKFLHPPQKRGLLRHITLGAFCKSCSCASVTDGGAEPEGPPAEEDADDCPFCAFMKAGPCGQAFRDWEKCVDTANKDEEDIVTKCTGPTRALKECMEANPEYYAPVLDADDAKEEGELAAEKPAGGEGSARKEAARKAEVRRPGECLACQCLVVCAM